MGDSLFVSIWTEYPGGWHVVAT